MSTPIPSQQPIASGFNAHSTSADVMAGVDLQGKVAVVTGGHSGLGRETVRALAHAGARVIVPARDVAKAQAMLAEVPAAEIWPMDLVAPASIDAFAQRFLSSGKALDLLVLSAGIMALPARTLDARGLELQFATNHLGHFQLTGRLWPALAARSARVVAVSSRGHRFSPMVFDDPNFLHRPYDRWLAYGQSKTANVLFACELDRLGQAHGVRAFAVHPGGIVDTQLAQHLSREELRSAGAVDDQGRPLIDPDRGYKSVAQGAATQLWCATSPQLAGLGGVYCEDADVAPLMADVSSRTWEGQPESRQVAGVKPYAVDPVAARRLWAMSEELTGVAYPGR